MAGTLRDLKPIASGTAKRRVKVRAKPHGTIADLKPMAKAEQPRGTAKLAATAARPSQQQTLQKTKSGTAKLAPIKTLKPKVPDKGQTGGVSDIGLGHVKANVSSALHFLGRAGGDVRDTVVHLPANTYEPFAALKEAVVDHDRSRAQRFRAGFIEHDPLYLAGDAAVKAVSGDSKGAREAIGKAGHEINQHPGNFALEVGGLKGGLGRGTTRVQKALGKEMPVRAPKVVPHTNIATPRPYSKDAMNRAVQVGVEKHRVKRTADLRTMADELERQDPVGNRHDIAAARVKANELDPTRAGNKQAKVRAARRFSLDRSIDESRQAGLMKDLRLATTVGGKPRRFRKGGAKASTATVLHAQNIARSLEEVQNYRDRVAANYHNLSPAERASASKTLDELDAVLAAKPDELVTAAQSAAFKDIQHPLTERLHEIGVIKREQTAKATEVPYAVTHMDDVVPGKVAPHRETPGSSRLTVEEIRAHREDAGYPEPAWVSNRPPGAGPRGGRNLSMPKAGGGPRGGKAVAAGLADVTPSALPRSVGMQQRLINLHDSYQQRIKEFSAPVSDEKLSRAKAEKIAKDLSEKEGIDYIAVPSNPFRGSDELRNVLNEDPDSLPARQAVRNSLRDAYDPEVEGGHVSKAGDVGDTYHIMPAAAAKEFSALAGTEVPKSGFQAGMKAVSSTFRRTVLATSPTWLTGNVVEGTVRTLLNGVRPGDYRLGKRGIAELEKYDPYAAESMRAMARGGGHYSAADAYLQQRGELLSYLDRSNPHTRRLGDAMEKFWEHPVPDRARSAWDDFTHFMFNQVNGGFEGAVRLGMMGKVMREQNLVDPKILKLSDDAVHDGAAGLRDTNAQAALGEELAKMYGRYEGFASGTRAAIQNYTPFLAWWMNSARFVLHTMPTEHPTAVAVAAALQTMERDTQEQGVPDWLQSTIKVGGGHINWGRYTPFGWFDDPLGNAGKLLMPQFSGAVQMAVFGQDWKGTKLRDDAGNPIGLQERAGRTGLTFLGGVVPVVQKAAAVATKGPSALNPVRVIPNAPPKSGGSGGSGKAYDPLAGYGGADAGGASDPTLPGGSGGGGSSDYDPLAGYSP